MTPAGYPILSMHVLMTQYEQIVEYNVSFPIRTNLRLTVRILSLNIPESCAFYKYYVIFADF